VRQHVSTESGVLRDFYRRLFNCLGVKIIDMFFFNDIVEKGAVLSKPEHLKQAYIIGRNLKDIMDT